MSTFAADPNRDSIGLYSGTVQANNVQCQPTQEGWVKHPAAAGKLSQQATVM